MDKLKQLFNDYISIERHNAFKMGYEQGQKAAQSSKWVVGDKERGLFACNNCGVEQPFVRSKENNMVYPVFPSFCYNCGCKMELSTEIKEIVNQIVNQIANQTVNQTVNQFDQKEENDVVDVQEDQITDKE